MVSRLSLAYAEATPGETSAAVDSREWEALYRRHAPMIHRRCRALLADEQESLDAVHDVFLQIQRRLPSFRGDADIATWIYRVATNLCLNRLRRARTRSRVLALVGREVPTAQASPQADLQRRQLLSVLLGRLSAEDVQLLVHRYHDEMGQAEIAALLGVTERTVRNRLQRALSKIQAHLADLEALEGTP